MNIESSPPPPPVISSSNTPSLIFRSTVPITSVLIAFSLFLLLAAPALADSDQPNLCFETEHADWMPVDATGFQHLKQMCESEDEDQRNAAWHRGWAMHPDNGVAWQQNSNIAASSTNDGEEETPGCWLRVRRVIEIGGLTIYEGEEYTNERPPSGLLSPLQLCDGAEVLTPSTPDN